MSVPYNIKPYDAGQVRRYRPSPRKGRPCPPEDLASFLYRIVMPSHPPATNARLAALRNGSRNADKIQTIPERNDGRIRNRMFLPLTHLGSRTNLRSGFSCILFPKRLLQPPKYLRPAKAVVESDCCHLQSRASDSTLFRYSTQKTGPPTSSAVRTNRNGLPQLSETDPPFRSLSRFTGCFPARTDLIFRKKS